MESETVMIISNLCSHPEVRFRPALISWIISRMAGTSSRLIPAVGSSKSNFLRRMAISSLAYSMGQAGGVVGQSDRSGEPVAKADGLILQARSKNGNNAKTPVQYPPWTGGPPGRFPGHLKWERWSTGTTAPDPAWSLLGRAECGFLAFEQDLPKVGRYWPLYQIEQGASPGPVGTDERLEAERLYFEVDLIDGNVATKMDGSSWVSIIGEGFITNSHGD